MNPLTFPPIPLDTAKAAQAVFGRSNFYLTAGDQANRLLSGILSEDTSGQLQIPSRNVAMLHLITIFQFIETLPDQLAQDAVRERVDWMYALHLPLNTPGMEAGTLCQFRRWLLVETTRQHTLQTLLERLSEVSDFPGSGQKNLDAQQIITVVCQISRLARIWEAFNRSMEALAAKNPKWLLENSLPHWYEVYSQHHKSLNLRADTQARFTLAQTIGADGAFLLEKISQSGNSELANLIGILLLRQVWLEQFELDGGKFSWRKEGCAGCSSITRLTFPINFVW